MKQEQQQGNNKNTPESLLKDITDALGFDPTRGLQPDKDAFQEALKEITKERQEKATAAAIDLARKAIQQSEDFARLQKEFKKASEAFVKEFGKTMNRIKALSNGQALVEGEEEENQEKTS